MTLQGIDVSHYQTVSEYEDHLGPLTFFFARASIGTQRDGTYGTHIARARQAGITRLGAYHFNHDAVSIADQVAVFLDAAGEVPFLFLDVEGEHAFSQAQAKNFIGRVHAAGRKIGLYHSTSGYFDAGQDYRWVADYRKGLLEPPIAWDFWQYGPYYGVDGNVFNGSLAKLDSLAQRESPMAFYRFTAQTGRYTIKAGTTPKGYKIGEAGFLAVKEWGASPTNSSAHFDQVVARVAGTTTPSSLLHGSDGFFEGLYISSSEVDETWDTPAPAPDLAAAELAGRRAEWDRQNTDASVALAPRP